MGLKYPAIVAAQDDLGRLGICNGAQLSVPTAAHELHGCF